MGRIDICDCLLNTDKENLLVVIEVVVHDINERILRLESDIIGLDADIHYARFNSEPYNNIIKGIEEDKLLIVNLRKKTKPFEELAKRIDATKECD